jgi:hypothetical protein
LKTFYGVVAPYFYEFFCGLFTQNLDDMRTLGQGLLAFRIKKNATPQYLDGKSVKILPPLRNSKKKGLDTGG